MLSLPERRFVSGGRRGAAGAGGLRSGSFWGLVPGAHEPGAGSGAGSRAEELTGELALLSVPDRARRLGFRAGREEGEGRQDRSAFLVLAIQEGGSDEGTPGGRRRRRARAVSWRNHSPGTETGHRAARRPCSLAARWCGSPGPSAAPPARRLPAGRAPPSAALHLTEEIMRSIRGAVTAPRQLLAHSNHRRAGAQERPATATCAGAASRRPAPGPPSGSSPAEACSLLASSARSSPANCPAQPAHPWEGLGPALARMHVCLSVRAPVGGCPCVSVP